MKKTLILWAVLLTGCFFILSCENDQKAIDDFTSRKTLPEEAVDIESFLSQGGELKAKLVSPYMLRYRGDSVYSEFPKTLAVDFYDDSARVESWLTAMYGKYYENLNKVYLRDSVVVINRDGDTLRCPELWWDQSLQKFYTDKPARLDGPGKHLVGNEGMDATQDLRSIIFKFPTGPMQVKENQ